MLKNGTMPSIPTLEKICEGFKISMSQFFSEDYVFATLSAEQREHLNEWNSLSDENKMCVGKFTSFLKEQQRDIKAENGK